MSNDETPHALGAERRAEDAEAALAAALEERNRLWAKAHRDRALERELAELRKMLEDMEGSVSWRLTAPLRQAKGASLRYRELAKRARRRLREG